MTTFIKTAAVAFVLTVIAGLLLIVVAPASASTEHCPDKDNPAKVEVGEGFGPSVTIPAGHEFCVKAGTQASGVLLSDGSEYTVTWTNKGGQTPGISYYIDYGCVEGCEPEPEPSPTPTPETTPTPEPTPSVSPTPEPTPTDSPDPEPTPTVEPVEHDVSIIPICAYGGESAALDVTIKSEGYYTITVDGEAIAEFNAPAGGVISDFPLEGNLGVYFDDTGEKVSGGTYSLDCGEPVDDPTPVVEELPNTGPEDALLIGTLGLCLLGAGTWITRKYGWMN